MTTFRDTEHLDKALDPFLARVAALDVPIPCNSALENMAIPDAGVVAESIRAVVRSR